ncbi:MAG: hypothetical protein U0V70_10940 [Terriglobia bacterium]
MKRKKIYALRRSMVLEKKYKGRLYSLRVLTDGRKFHFQLGNAKFPSLTAAAKFVCSGNHEINGPRFWGAPQS